jgi:DNA-binding HxlR family transcriptional regulator
VLYSVLNRLVNQGLVERDVSGPPRVRYRLSGHGSGLMAAWWQVAEDWGIDHIDDLFPIVAATSSWYVKDPSD